MQRQIDELKKLNEEAQAVIAHFKERPIITAENCTEEDARWIMRYDAVNARFKELREAGLIH